MSRRERRDSDDISRPMERRSRPYDDEGRRSDYRRPLMPPPGSTPRGPRGGGPPQRRRGIAIDRAQTCPFLLRVFYRMGSHHNDGDFAKLEELPVDEELQVYTWPDASLREISDLIEDILPESRGRTKKLSFRLIYPDRSGRFVMARIGEVYNSHETFPDGRTLAEVKFQPGDFLDVAILDNEKLTAPLPERPSRGSRMMNNRGPADDMGENREDDGKEGKE
ncbi:Histone deacetylase complex subunit sap18 [Perkinsus olseni]|uniref:Histone deacetylase complex subunit sap18 n=2 Tax=Perkinsus olseni TaxID=32597 RepID=A0A7J6MGL9_PEROL|nr:Histone deacetylase complex subunit sap18 [Perkinsus olseni]KAF4670614.1 Histone deacetylase complex subunit sap18 [Perkinsus olseni]